MSTPSNNERRLESLRQQRENSAEHEHRARQSLFDNEIQQAANLRDDESWLPLPVNPFEHRKTSSGSAQRPINSPVKSSPLSNPHLNFNLHKSPTKQLTRRIKKAPQELKRKSQRLTAQAATRKQQHSNSNKLHNSIKPSTKRNAPLSTQKKAPSSSSKIAANLSRPRVPPCERCIKKMLNSLFAEHCFDRVQTSSRSSSRCSSCSSHTCHTVDTDLANQFMAMYRDKERWNDNEMYRASKAQLLKDIIARRKEINSGVTSTRKPSAQKPPVTDRRAHEMSSSCYYQGQPVEQAFRPPPRGLAAQLPLPAPAPVSVFDPRYNAEDHLRRTQPVQPAWRSAQQPQQPAYYPQQQQQHEQPQQEPARRSPLQEQHARGMLPPPAPYTRARVRRPNRYTTHAYGREHSGGMSRRSSHDSIYRSDGLDSRRYAAHLQTLAARARMAQDALELAEAEKAEHDLMMESSEYEDSEG